FDEDLMSYLPSRALPVAAEVPPNFAQVIQTQVEVVRQLLADGRRRGADARSIVRSIANLEAALDGSVEAPTDSDIVRRTRQIKAGTDLQGIFPNVAALSLAEADAVSGAIFVSVRIAKEGIPV